VKFEAKFPKLEENRNIAIKQFFAASRVEKGNQDSTVKKVFELMYPELKRADEADNESKDGDKDEEKSKDRSIDQQNPKHKKAWVYEQE
jgi:hypothetical protein